jgi:hypothetical protein
MSSSARDTAIKTLEGRRLARIMGRPTMKHVNQTRNKIASEYAKARTSHPSFPQGSRFGFASAILKKENSAASTTLWQESRKTTNLT